MAHCECDQGVNPGRGSTSAESYQRTQASERAQVQTGEGCVGSERRAVSVKRPETSLGYGGATLTVSRRQQAS